MLVKNAKWVDLPEEVRGISGVHLGVVASFDPSFRHVDGVAVLRLQGWGAFTIGAVADSGWTILEIDLAEVSSAPTKFRER